MIMAAGKVFMAQYINYSRIIITAIIGLLTNSGMASTLIGTAQTTQFTANIIDGTCELDQEYNGKVLTFMPRMASEFSTGKTLEIKEISTLITCNYEVTPKVMISGNTPYYSNSKIFLDSDAKWPAGTNGVGFMVQPARSIDERNNRPPLNDFYSKGMAGKAIANGETMSWIPLNEQNNFTENQVLWVGLVGLTESQNIVPGSFQATLTITGIIP